MKLIQRIQAPTPKFFKVLRSIGLSLLGIGAAVVASPVALPAVVVTLAGYLSLAGGVVSAMSQLTIPEAPQPEPEEIPITDIPLKPIRDGDEYHH